MRASSCILAIGRRPIRLAALLATLSACTVGPNYQRPAPAGKTPAAFKEPPPPPGLPDGAWKPASPADVTVRGKWWEMFGDAQLSTLEEKIAVSNQSLKAATAQYLAAREQVRVARAGYFPTLTAGPSATHTRESYNQPGTIRGVTKYDFNTYALQSQALWEPDLWGSVRRTVEQARANVQATAADLANVELSLRCELASDYFELRGLDTQRQLLESTLASDLDFLHLTQVRFNGGIATEVDVAQAETQYRAVKAQSIDLGVARSALEHAIALLVGVPPSDFSLAAAPLAVAGPVPGIPGGVPSALLERRPDIAGAERRTAAANAAVGIAVAAYYPHFTLGASAGLDSGVLGTLFQVSSFFWSLGASATETLFDAGRRHALTDQARDQYEGQVATYRQTILNAFREVEDSLAALRILSEEADAETEAVEAARHSLALSTKRYKGGVTTYLEVLTAQTIQLASERAQADIASRRYAASVQLVKALGGGWDSARLASTN
ncbi:MAG TPA: efflux transporter outer membrane subunit [Polyangia bacterium]|jgi:NodT family efflux transporter outer membrane factor (OMF) lipoprotein